MNLPNLIAHIASGRSDADIAVTKGPDHRIVSISHRAPEFGAT